jgi:hypothetical protein
VLGKAFFWDQQAGSDGLACASCHFHAGADNRVVNQLDPGLRNTNPAVQNNFHVTASNRSLNVGPPPGGGPNYTLKKADYPFHQLSDPADRNSAVPFDMINAIFNFPNFWITAPTISSTARNPFGMRDPTAGVDSMNSVLVADGVGNLLPMPVTIPDASLASQTVGPPGSDLEMSCRAGSSRKSGGSCSNCGP